MERVARLLKDRKVSRELLTDEDIARAVWPAAVGKTIAAHTLRVKLVRRKLLVEVEDGTWQRQLYALSSQIVARVRKLTGSDQVEDIEFRIGILRRQPQRAESLNAAEDEADRIQDPVLKKVYRLSRRKAVS